MRDATHIDLSFRATEDEPVIKRVFSCDLFSAERVRMVASEPYDFAYRGDGHYLALHDIVRSEGESFVEGVRQEHVKDIRSKMTFIPADCTVSGWTAPLQRRNSFLVLYLDPKKLARQVAKNGQCEDFAPAMYFENPALLATLSKLDALMREQALPDPLYAESLGLLASIELYRVLGAAKAPQASKTGNLSPKQMQNLFEFMQERLHLDLSLPELATVAGLSQFHFARLFKATTGESPHQYVLSLRVARARDLLREPGRPVAEIASASGFKGPVQFNRAFARIVGMTPSEYRRSL